LDVLKGKVARELAALEEQLDRVFERAFGPGVRLPGRSDSFRPPLDAYQTEDAIVLHVDLAGVSPEDVRVVVDGEYVQISGRRVSRYVAPPRHHLQMEVPQGQFERVLRLQRAYDPDGVTASLDAGVLTVRFPLRAKAARSIPVKS
jgi:HSP20 family protein